MLRTADKRLFVGSRLEQVLRPAVSAGAPPLVLHPFSPEFSTATPIELNVVGNGSGIVSAAWFAANCPLAVPFYLAYPITIFQLGWTNGSGTMSENADVGVYSSGFARKISTGSTARTGVSALQLVDVADTVIAPGKYWLTMSNNGTAANQQTFWSASLNAVMWGMFGVQDSATTALPLPDPLTNMAAAATATRVPHMFIVARAVL